MDTPEALEKGTARLAAYIATQQRIDARSNKTRANVKCTLPNTKCGNRCIPAEWDCRLKGEGNDNLVRARRTDPISGFANIERGIKRLGKFATTGSFSDLEGGKRSLVRGAVKLKPGNLKEKNEFKDWIEDNYSKIIIPLAIASISIAGHAVLKKGSTRYREGMGGKVDRAVANGIDAVLDITPGIAQGRTYTRNRAAAATSADLERISIRTARGKAPIESLLPQTAISPGLVRGNSDLNTVLSKVNAEKSANSFYQWNAKHQEAFWTAETKDGKSIYAEATAKASINSDWNLGLDLKRADGRDIRIAIEDRIIGDKTAYIALAKQQGFKVLGRPGNEYLPSDQLDRFIQRTTAEIKDVKRQRVHGAYLGNILDRRSPSTAARTIYDSTVKSYDEYYKKVGKAVTQRAGVSPIGARAEESGVISIAKAAERRRIDYLMAYQSGKYQTQRSSTGPGHDKLFMLNYYHTRVAGNAASVFTISNDDAIKAASDLSGTVVRSPQQAIGLLNSSYGYPGARTPIVQSGERPARRRRMSRAQLIAVRVRAGYSVTEAEAYADRIISERGDAADDSGLPLRIQIYLEKKNRLDFTPSGEREGKPCGKSFIRRNQKCSKPTTARYAKEESEKQSGVASNIAKGALAAGLAVGSIAAYKNRRAIGSAAGVVRKTVKAERNAYKSILGAKLKQRNSYGGQQYTRRTAQRAAFKEYRTSRQEALSKIYATQSPKYYNAAIQKLSSDDVTKALTALPKSFQEPARNLSGKAKAGLAYLSADAQGFKVNKINKESNFSVLSKEDGSKTIAIGSVGDTLVTFNADRSNGSIDMKTEGGGRGLPVYDIQFMTDLSFKQKTGVSKADSTKVASMIKSMNKDSLPTLPKNALLRNIPYSDDGLGRKRGAIYKRFGYTSLEGIRGDYMFATLSNGVTAPIKPEYKSFYADLIKGDDYDTAAAKFAQRGRRDAASTRNDKRCGKSGIPDNQKCTKTATSVSPAATTNTTRNVAIGAGALTAVGAVSALALIGVQKGKASAYRRNVPKSALEAEKLAIEYERQFRDKAAQRLGKRPQDVTGFEASAYDYRDKGYDRGFGAFESDPKWYGQTQQSKGAVVILSYADERGQGGFKMAEGGAFKSIWGERDILPFSNNISQPKSRSGPDDLDVQGEKRVAETVGRVAGPVGESATKTGFMVGAALKRFKFLRDNVNERGFNPDAVRAAAFVVAQRRLTGKSVDILSYSNGGNVATETLAILQDMGYRDVKVVNIAGPTFGMFEHSRDNMRTWVSEGDEFYKATAGRAYTGGNNTMLKNKNIPHGLQDGIDPNNQENGANARANLKAKNSYLLDEQLQKEAYQFLTVDKKRSSELTNEVVWRVAENKPFEGDLEALFGSEASSVKATMASSLSNSATKEKAKERIRDLIEDKMLEKWYGGYNPKTVKKAQTAIREELTRNVTRPARSSVKPKRPQTISQRITDLMAQNPGMTREAARNRIMRQRSSRSDAYTKSFAVAHAALSTARL